MKQQLFISSYVIVRNGIAISNGKIFLENKNVPENDFCQSFYTALQMNYVKFYKMDHLCKLAITSVELLLRNCDKEKYNSSETALVFSNASASLETDDLYFKAVDNKSNYFPSPSVFVYTLPNIMIGEIAIRHKFTGENALFLSEKFDAALLYDYIQSLLAEEKAKCTIAGWTEISESNFESVLFLIEQKANVEKINDGKVFSKESLNEIYTLT